MSQLFSYFNRNQKLVDISDPITHDDHGCRSVVGKSQSSYWRRPVCNHLPRSCRPLLVNKKTFLVSFPPLFHVICVSRVNNSTETNTYIAQSKKRITMYCIVFVDSAVLRSSPHSRTLFAANKNIALLPRKSEVVPFRRFFRSNCLFVPGYRRNTISRYL